MVQALRKEIVLRKDELRGEVVETIYFGGGTPSVLEVAEVNQLIDTVYANYEVVRHPEITLEANPDDLSPNRILELSKGPINRLSIGVQSFFGEDLKLMNRAHNALEARQSIKAASRYFQNISIDLIYGIPGMTNTRWLQNIETALAFNIPHISSYALTVEPKTALAHFIEQGVVQNVDDEVAQEHFSILWDTLTDVGYSCYEISNFGKPGYFSRNNTAYWQQKKYLGIGPSAHSYDGNRRGWNVRSNPKYIRAIAEGELPMEVEVLSKTDKYNEYVMTGLRTIWGVSLEKIGVSFGEVYKRHIGERAKKYLEAHLLYLDGDILLATRKGKFLVDGIASDLFMVNLS